MRQGIHVDLFPIFANEAGDQQQQGATGLVEVGNEGTDQTIGIAGRDEELGVAFQ